MLFAGVDLGGTKIQTVLMRGRLVIGQSRVPTPDSGGASVVQAIQATLKAAATSAGVKLSEIAAIGVGTPGSIDADRGVVSRASNIAGFEQGFDLGPRVSRAAGGLPVLLENDVRAAMLGEHRAGAGRPFRNLLGVFVGTGVGGGLVLEGKLRRGRGAAGEIGHTVVKDGGRECACGRLGCLEAYAGRGRMELTARRLVDSGRKTVLFKLMEKKKRTRLTSGVIVSALEAGDQVAEDLVEEATWALGIALANAQNLLDLEAIMIGGGLGDRLGEPFIKRVAAHMQPHLFVPDDPPRMLATELQDLSGAVGAAILATTLRSTGKETLSAPRRPVAPRKTSAVAPPRGSAASRSAHA